MNQVAKSTSFEGLRLAWVLAKRDLKNRYATTYAGVVWNVGVPLVNALVTVVVFSVLMKGRMGDAYNDVPFSLFFFVPFMLWMLFTELVGRSPSVLKEHGYLISKIAFPVWVLPLVPIASVLLSQVIFLIIILTLFAINGIAPAASIALFPLLWALVLIFAVGFAYGISALSAYIPDLVQATPIVLNIMFWLTPILYPPALVEAGATTMLRRVIMDFNPFYHFVESARVAVFSGASLSAYTFALLGLVSVTTLIVGARIFKNLQPGFADVI